MWQQSASPGWWDSQGGDLWHCVPFSRWGGFRESLSLHLLCFKCPQLKIINIPWQQHIWVASHSLQRPLAHMQQTGPGAQIQRVISVSDFPTPSLSPSLHPPHPNPSSFLSWVAVSEHLPLSSSGTLGHCWAFSYDERQDLMVALVVRGWVQGDKHL